MFHERKTPGKRRCGTALTASSCLGCSDLLYGTWDYQDFRKKHLSEYMAMCQDFGAEFTSKDMVL